MPPPPPPPLRHSISEVHLNTHLLFSQSVFVVSHLQSCSYCSHAVTELEPASAAQRFRRFGQLLGGVPQQSPAAVHSMSAHSRAVCEMRNVPTVQMPPAPPGMGRHARPLEQSFVTWQA